MTSALDVRRQMREPAASGFASAEEVVAEVAKRKGVTAASVRQELTTIEFLERRFPDLVAGRDPRLGISAAKLLERLDRTAPDLVADALEKTLTGELSRADLERFVTKTLKAREPAAKVGTQSRGIERAQKFEQAFGQYLSANASYICDHVQKLISNYRIDSFVFDFAIIDASGRTIGFDVKSPRLDTFKSETQKDVALNLLRQRCVDEIFHVLPAENRKAINQIIEIITRYKLNGLHVIAFDEAEFRSGGEKHAEIIKLFEDAKSAIATGEGRTGD